MSKGHFKRSWAGAGAVIALGVAVPVARATYGPETPQPSSAPGGYSQVVTGGVFGANRGVLRGSLGPVGAGVIIPAGEFTERVQVMLVKPHLGELAFAVHHHGLRRGTVIGGIGLSVSGLDGSAVNRFREPMKVAITLGKKAARAVILRYDAARGRFVRVHFSRGKNGTLFVATRTPGAFAVVLLPARRSRRHATGLVHSGSFIF